MTENIQDYKNVYEYPYPQKNAKNISKNAW